MSPISWPKLRSLRAGTLRTPALLAGAAALMAGCSGEEPAPPPAAPLVVIGSVDAHDLDDRIEATGELRAVEQAEIAAEVDGRVTELIRDEGDAVAAGDAILTIDPERRELELADARAQLAESKAGQSEARQEHDRIEKLEKRGVASNAQLETARSSLAAAQSRRSAAMARLGVAERALRDATVRAPFAGLVARRMVSRGEFVRPGEPLFELVALDPIEVEFTLAERDSGRVAPGQPVGVTVAPFPERIFDASVTMISPTIDPRTRTLRVKAQLDNSDGILRPGLFARADLGVEFRENVPMVAEEAVLQRADGAVVFRFLADSNRVERRIVRTGIYRGGEVEIIEGLDPGDWVVTRGHASLLDGALVRPRTLDGAEFSRPLAQAARGGDELETP
jgi:membrane fusion protein (multidrug efflux system)